MRATVDTVRGPVSVAWDDGEAFTLDLTVPGNTTAEVTLPVDGELSVSGGRDARVDGDGVTVGAGEWTVRVD